MRRAQACLSTRAASPWVYHSTSFARTGETQDKRFWQGAAPLGRGARVGEFKARQCDDDDDVT